MRRNTYVTASLFIVFALLTVVYFNMERPVQPEDGYPIAGTLNEVDIATAGEAVEGEAEDLEDSDDADVFAEQDAEAAEEAEEAEDADVMAEAEESEEAEEGNREVMSMLDVMRAQDEETRTAQVSSLQQVIASADFDATTKSAARDTLNEIENLANNGRALEAVFRNMGFEDVLVRPTSEFINVTIQVPNLDSVPTRAELAELYILAGIQFGSHRNGNITINFQPLN